MGAPRNLLVLMADQFRADLLQGALAAAVPTPNLDRLAAQSWDYRNHHTVTVPCGPARASFLTGRYAFEHGSRGNGTPLPAQLPTIATELRRLGREPLLFGYTDTQPDPAGLHPDDPAHGSYTAPAPGFTEIQEMREEAWAWLAHLRARGYDVPDADAADLDRLYRPQTGALGGPALYGADDSDTAFLTDQTLAQLDIRKGRPWAAFVTYIRPHPPYVAPAPYHDLIDPAGLPTALSAPDHPFFDAFHSLPSQAGMFWGFDGDQRGLSPATVAKIRATYLGLVAELDHHIGRLLDWLEASGQAEETLVIFTADHGEMLGDLGLWGKQTPLRQASHIPLLIRAPEQGPAVIKSPSQSIDLAPTILSLLGGVPAPGMGGRCLDGQTHGEDLAMIELDLASGAALAPFLKPGAPAHRARAVALETSQWRLVQFANGFAPMLFDLAADPGAAQDLAHDHPEVVSNLTEQLLHHRMAQGA